MNKLIMLAIIALMFGTGCNITFMPKGKYMETRHPDNPNEPCYVKTLAEVTF